MKNKHHQRLLLIPVLVLLNFFNSCSSEKGENITVDEKSSKKEDVLMQGFTHLKNNCSSCHAFEGTPQAVAPTWQEIRTAYLKTSKSEEAFIKTMVSFVNQPSVENSLLPEAVAKFNLMPRMGVDEEKLTAIATFLYRVDIEIKSELERFLNGNAISTSVDSEKNPLELGQEIATQTKSVLGKLLMQTIQSKGTEHAIDFCSTKAIPVTDSMGRVHHAKVKRVSDKNRNPLNQANKEELAYINACKTSLKNNQTPTPKLLDKGSHWVGYYPITINAMCLQCHGTPGKDISEKTYAAIQKKYPKI